MKEENRRMKRFQTAKLRWDRKLLTLGAVAVLLVGAVAANFLLGDAPAQTEASIPANVQNTGEAVVSASTGSEGFFESFRTERDTTRAQEISYLDMIVQQGADAETLADAQQQKLDIVGYMEKELTVESLLKAKGFSDAAVTLHAGSVNVILSAETLSDEQVAQVLDIVMRETGEGAENIKVTTAQ